MSVETDHSTLTAADRRWFAERIEVLLPELHGTALRLCGDSIDAEDLVAAAVAKAWEALPDLRDRDAFRGWVFRILNNAFVSQCRSAHARTTHQPLDEVEASPFSLFERLHQPFLLWWGNPESEFLDRLVRDDLTEAIDALPAEFRSVVVMVDVQGLAYREASEILDIPIGTVRSRLSRGRGLLQEALWEHAVDAGLRDASPSGGSEGPESHPHREPEP
jgi:RNA polymerase sigma-70 factor, ECF subfamily